MAVIESKYIDVGVYGGYGFATYGYDTASSSTFGDIADTANGTTNSSVADLYSGETCPRLFWLSSGGTTQLYLYISGDHTSGDSVWDTLKVGASTYTRSSATSVTYDGTNTWTQWIWSSATNPFGTTAGVDILVTWEGTPAITAPVINNVTDNNASASSVTATVNLTSNGSGGTLEYAQTTTTAVPTTGWQASSSFSHPRGTTRYYWASQDQDTSGAYDGPEAHTVGYIAPDTTVTPSSSTIGYTATSATTTVSNVTSGEYYSVRLNNGGTTLTNDIATSTSINLTFTDSLPAAGATTTYEIFANRPTAIGGSGTSVETNDTFTVTRDPEPVTAPTDLTFSTATTASATTNVTVTASGGTGGTLQVSQDGTNWVANGTAFSKTRGTNYTFYARRIGEGGSISSSYSEAYTVPYLAADTTVAATSSTILYVDTSATTTISGVDRATEEVAVRLNNGSTNIATRTGNGDITFSTSLPAANTTTTYEIFTQRPVATGGDGTTWYATDDTFTVTRDPEIVTAPTDLAFTVVQFNSATTPLVVTGSGGSGGVIQVSDDNATWQDNGFFFSGPYTRGTSYTFYARRLGDGGSTSSSYSEAFTPPYQLPGTGATVASLSQIPSTATSVDIEIGGGSLTNMDVAIRDNNGTTNLAESLNFQPVDTITLSTGLPAVGSTNTYEIFTRRPVVVGGDGVTWYETNVTFNVEKASNINLSAGLAISLNDIQNFFGGTSPVDITEYYRGGGLVPDIPQNSNIPTTGEITLENFYDAEKYG